MENPICKLCGKEIKLTPEDFLYVPAGYYQEDRRFVHGECGIGIVKLPLERRLKGK